MLFNKSPVEAIMYRNENGLLQLPFTSSSSSERHDIRLAFRKKNILYIRRHHLYEENYFHNSNNKNYSYFRYRHPFSS